VHSYLRNRAGLPPVVTGSAVFNQGHRALYERELLLFDNVLPKDVGIRDGLQLVDGAHSDRHLVLPVPTPASSVGAPKRRPGSPAAAAVASAAIVPPLPLSLVAPGTGVVLPTPPHAMRLASLPAGVPVFPGSQAAREAELAAQDDWDDEEEDEIRPVSDEYAAQWAVHRATRR